MHKLLMPLIVAKYFRFASLYLKQLCGERSIIRSEARSRHRKFVLEFLTLLSVGAEEQRERDRWKKGIRRKKGISFAADEARRL